MNTHRYVRPTLLALESASLTRDRILKASVALFAEKGYEAVSVREIARAVDIKAGSLYNHFASKEEILNTIFALYESAVSRTITPLEKIPGILDAMTPRDFLVRGLELFEIHLGSEPMEQIWRIFYLEQYRNSEARRLLWEKVLQPAETFMEEAFRQMMARGLIKNMDPAVLAMEYQYPIFMLMTSYVIAKLDGRDPAPARQKMHAHLNFFWEIIRPD